MASKIGWPTVVGLGIVLVGPEAIAAISKRAGANNLAVQLFLQLLFCSLAVLILVIVRYGERLPLASIGLRKPTWDTVVTAVLLFGTGFLLIAPLTAPLVERWGRAGVDAGIAELAILPAWFRIFIAVTSGAVEETLYRGYAV